MINEKRLLIFKLLKSLGLSSVIFIFFLPFLLFAENLPNDWDYFAQLYEASRKTILEHGQFPWWNAWQMGGIPLYANPQYGLFSIQTVFVILFGTILGLKLSIVFYALIGFWGMRQLLLRLKTNSLYASLISYIWIFSSFPIWHFSVGHFTFTTYFFAPWIFYLLLDIHKKPRNWFYLVLVVTSAIQSGFHYTTIQLLLLATIFVAIRLIYQYKFHNKKVANMVTPLAKAALLIIILNLHKVFWAVVYLRDYPRIPVSESRTPTNLLISALTHGGSQPLDTVSIFNTAYAWHEFTAYFSILALSVYCFLIIYRLIHKIRPDLFWLFVLFSMVCLLLALGPFMGISPYAILKRLPGFEQTQVATRWLGWFVFFALLSFHALPKRKVLVVILFIALTELIYSNYGVINKRSSLPASSTAPAFEQYAYHNLETGNAFESMRLYQATRANVGEIYGYEPILGFGGNYNESGYDPLILRCGINRGCPFVLSKNAEVVSWSPNIIELRRTGPGDIELNINPGGRWKINDKNAFDTMKIVELTKQFTISDPSDRIILKSN